MIRYLTLVLACALAFSAAHAQENAPAFSDAPPDANISQPVVSEEQVTEEQPVAATPQTPLLSDENVGGVSQEVIDIQSAPQGSPTEVLNEPVEPKAPEYEDQPQVELRILDKVRAESRTYILNVGRTVAYANIRIRPRACRKSSPLDAPEDAAFLQIWEVKPDGASAWIFSGWMFASSPSLSAMDHPVYDVTVLDCKDPVKEAKDEAEKAKAEKTTGETGPEGEETETSAPEEAAAPQEEAAPAGSEEPANETPVEDSAAPKSE